MPQCPKCYVSIKFLPRFKELLKIRKEQIVQIFDQYFSLKSNMNKLIAVEDIDGFDEDFKKYVIKRCQDKTTPLSYTEYQNLKAKLTVIDHLKKSDPLEILSQIVSDMNDPDFNVGPNYLKDVISFMKTKSCEINPSKFGYFVCFSKGSWIVSDPPKSNIFYE